MSLLCEKERWKVGIESFVFRRTKREEGGRREKMQWLTRSSKDGSLKLRGRPLICEGRALCMPPSKPSRLLVISLAWCSAELFRNNTKNCVNYEYKDGRLFGGRGRQSLLLLSESCFKFCCVKRNVCRALIGKTTCKLMQTHDPNPDISRLYYTDVA